MLVDLRKDKRKISNSFVADNSSEHTYNPKLTLFILWLFDNDHRKFINPLMLTSMIGEDNADTTNFKTEVAARSKKTNTRRKKKAAINKRTNLRKLIVGSIENTPPAEGQGETHKSPLNIDGDNAIDSEIVKDYMTTNMNHVWVDRSVAEEHLNECNVPSQINDDMVNEKGKVECQVYQSKSQYNGIRSSLAYLYTLARVPKFTKELSTYLKGMDRSILSSKQKLGLKISEGKKALSFDAYSMLAKKLFESEFKEDIFAHLFLVLEWCLMKRAENCVHAKINHISSEDDCLVFEFAKSKGHQRGEEQHLGPCSHGSAPNLGWPAVPLFQGRGKSIYNRYSERLNKIVKESATELKAMKYEPGDLGSHSTRKGVASMVAAGCTIAPPIVSLCIRAGWALGGEKDKYLLRENAGDQYFGRCASSLDQNTKELGFEVRTISSGARLLAEKCFAAIRYHYKDLKENYLHAHCCLRLASLFRGITDEISSSAVVKYPWNKTEETPKPKASGIPPHVIHMAKMHELKLELRGLKNEMKDLKT
ncbi:hypothetical protein ACHAXR_003680, partial [Thalassiosira sp. AJA248-18]